MYVSFEPTAVYLAEYFASVVNPFVLEINTLPGLTALSDLPAQAKFAGISFDQLIEALLKSAFYEK